MDEPFLTWTRQGDEKSAQARARIRRVTWSERTVPRRPREAMEGGMLGEVGRVLGDGVGR